MGFHRGYSNTSAMLSNSFLVISNGQAPSHTDFINKDLQLYNKA